MYIKKEKKNIISLHEKGAQYNKITSIFIAKDY